MEEYNISGLAIDTRTEEEKALDFKKEEVSYGASPIYWEEKETNKWIKYPLRDQDGSSSCVKQAIAKAMETITGDVQSARYYRLRKNYPEKGMWLQDGGEIVRKIGIELEKDLPSQKLSENEMNKDVVIGNPIKIKNYFFANPKSIDDIAEVIKDWSHCVLTFESNYDEWTDVPKVKGDIKWGHAVCGVDYFLYEGEKAILIDESWGINAPLNGHRIITESFLKARCTGAMYFIYEPEEFAILKPTAHFTAPLTYGMKNYDIKILQNILKYEGFFPKTTDSTGNFLNLTANALKKWQVYHNILDFKDEKDLKKIRFGNKSIALCNKLYA
jgi:hypothetical protein